MVLKVSGIIRGDRIDLDRTVTDLPSGSAVNVIVAPRELSREQEDRLIEELCGAWSGDPTLGPIFDTILRERSQAPGRVIPFNGSP